MEQILAFVLGVSAVAFVWAIVVAFKTAALAKQNQETIRNIEQWCSQNNEEIHRRIDNIYEESIRYTDSRVDKLDAKFCSDGKALTEKSKEFLKG